MSELPPDYWVALPDRLQPYEVNPGFVEGNEYVRQRALDALREFPQSREGINFDRIQAYAEVKNLVVPDILVIEQATLPLINKLYGVLIDQEIDPSSVSAYSAQVPIVIAIRNKDHETLNGSDATEADIVHEIGHAQQDTIIKNLVWQGPTGILAVPRQFRDGLRVRHWQSKKMLGSFFTEAQAELYRADYVETVLDKPHGFTEEPADIKPWVFRGFTFQLPTKYTFKKRFPDDATKVGIGAVRSAYASYAMELLNEKNPDMLGLLKKANSSTDYIRDFIKAVNAIEPRLFSYLHSLPNDSAGMTAGLLKVAEIVQPDALSLDSTR